MVDKCLNCGKPLIEEGYFIYGSLGKWRAKKITVCDVPCLLEWDTTGFPPSKGNQGVNLANAIYNLNPISPPKFPALQHPTSNLRR